MESKIYDLQLKTMNFSNNFIYGKKSYVGEDLKKGYDYLT